MTTKLSFNSLALTFLCLIAFNSISYSQNGLDPSFGDNGTAIIDFDNESDNASSILKLTNGKILISGLNNNWVNSNTPYQYKLAAALYTADGTLDTTFGANGKILFGIDDMHIETQDSAQDNAGNIYFSGLISNQDHTETQAFLIKFNPNGIIDTSFGDNGLILTNYGTNLQSYALNIVIQSDNKIIISGYIVSGAPDNIYEVALVRYNQDGTLDTSFGVDGYVLTSLADNLIILSQDSAILPDGKILVMGWALNSDNTRDLGIMRYNENGTLDNTFGNNGISVIDILDTDQFSYLTVQANGKLILTGNGFNEGAGSADAVIVRLNANGTLDTSFNNVGYVINNLASGYFGFINSFVNGDGSVLAIGCDTVFPSTSTFFAKYTIDGMLDTSFNNTGLFEFEGDNSPVLTQAIINDGKILTAGKINNSSNGTKDDFYMAQFNLDDFLGIEAITSGFISVYPNPANEFVNITLSNAMTDTQIQIFDVLGKEVLSLTANTERIVIPVDNLNSGVYFMRVNQNGTVFTEKLIKN